MKYAVTRAAKGQICVGCALLSKRCGFNQAYSYFARRRRKDTLQWGAYPTKDAAWERVLEDSENCARLGDLMFIRDKEDE